MPGDDSTVGSSPFVALSYRWGLKPSVGVVPESLPDLQRPGILDYNEASGWVSPLPSQARHLPHLGPRRALFIGRHPLYRLR